MKKPFVFRAKMISTRVAIAYQSSYNARAFGDYRSKEVFRGFQERLGHETKLPVEVVTNLKRPPIHRVIVAQISATIFVTAVSLVLFSAPTAVSVFLGGTVSSASNAFFAAHAFKYRGARNAQKIVKAFLAGEIGKFSITVVLFALCFSLLPNVVELAIILAFITVHLVGVVAAVRVDYSPSRR
ncbi:MAG: hypothetical protein CMQ45_04665 [Gammaproteobacteria bacterium]|nr:hypothetical protein [Gammaproteobacteria bacterium]|tara:strand:+ start:952 stop:1503 length:552 start_codon:yes stop_codon:yes gene_type:complete